MTEWPGELNKGAELEKKEEAVQGDPCYSVYCIKYCLL